MKISEMLSQDLLLRPPQTTTTTTNPSSSTLLEALETSVKEAEHLSSSSTIPSPTTLQTLTTKLQTLLAHLTTSSFSFTPSSSLQIWKLSYRLWNACVDFTNSSYSNSSIPFTEQNASLRQISADLLLLAGPTSGIPSPAFKSASFLYKTGLIWHDLNKFDLAANNFEKATDLISKIETTTITDPGEQKLILDLNIARAGTAWEVSEKNVAVNLLNRGKSLLFGCSERFRELAEQYLMFGKVVLARKMKEETSETLMLMNEALDLCEKGLRFCRRPEESFSLKTVRSKILRFMAAAHLQGDEFESVLKCVRFLREDGGEQHPSLPVLAMKGWLGLGKCVEAEKELRGMVVNKGIPETIWLSAVEDYFKEAGGVAGAETVKGLFLGLLGRCHVSPYAATRMVHRVVSGGSGSGELGGSASRLRAKVVSELVSDERVLLLFAGEEVANERTTMHSVLWNCGADHFRAKDYETAAEMFEKSMLYVPRNVENTILRSKCFRVLCLCHLGLSQLDRAEEYINEANKLHPDITCAFLKFKIYLQNKDEDGAIHQMKAMTSCLDFTPDYLILSAHESIASNLLSVAISSLSNLLNFYAPGKTMPTPQVVVLRTLITLLSRDPSSDLQILDFTKQAKTQMLKVNPESFFGKGEVGKRERNWFAVNSWNAGTRAGREKKFELFAEFLELASEFYGVTINGEVEDNRAMVCKALILSASGMIASEKQGNAPLLDSDVKRALELLDRAGQILTSISCGTQLGDESITIEPTFFFVHTCNTYELRGRLADPGYQQQQLLCIKNYASSKACTPLYLLQIGMNASQGQRPNLDVADYALNTCLSSLISSPCPDYKTIAVILRKLIGIAANKNGTVDGEAYNVYKQAYRFMVGLKVGQYPADEAKWLFTSAWNCAALPVRLGQVGLAKKWMRIGLELAQHVPGSYRDSMEEFLAEYDKKFEGHEDG